MKKQLFTALTALAFCFGTFAAQSLFAQEPPQQETPPAAQKPDDQDKPADVKPQEPKQDDNCKDPKSKNCVGSIGNRNVGKGINLYSIQREIGLGKQLAQDVEHNSKLVDDPVITEYVNRVGQNIVRNSDCVVPFTFKVIDSDEVNAFALPGGFFYVNTGLILRAQEESELAGVMAHETAHVCARHGTKGATKAEIIQLAAGIGSAVIPYSAAGIAIYQGMNMAIPLTYLAFTRKAEAEADFLGLQYMYKAGYDPNSYVTFFERVLADEKRRPGTIPKVFSTHPPTEERIGNTQKEIARILPAKDEYITTTSEFDAVKARLQATMSAKKAKPARPDQPTLRTQTEQDKDKKKAGGQEPPANDDDRPTLKRRDGDPDQKPDQKPEEKKPPQR